VSKIKIGLIGCGNWGKNILRDLLALGACVYVADTGEAARERAEKSGASGVTDDFMRLPDCDGYVVAVTIPGLARVVSQILERKKPVFSEKTLLLSRSDYDELIDAGGADLVFCMHKWGYHPGVHALAKTANSGQIGGLRQLQVFRECWSADFHLADVIWCHCIHDLVITSEIFGSLPENIHSISAIKDSNNTITGVTTVLKQGDFSAVLIENGRSAEKLTRISVLGTQGSASLYNPLDDHITVRTFAGEEKVPIETEMPLFSELREFLDHLNGGPRPRYGIEDGFAVSNFILKMHAKIEGDN